MVLDVIVFKNKALVNDSKDLSVLQLVKEQIGRIHIRIIESNRLRDRVRTDFKKASL